MKARERIKAIVLLLLIVNTLIMVFEILVYNVFLPGALLSPYEAFKVLRGDYSTEQALKIGGGTTGADIEDVLLLPSKILYATNEERRLIAYDKNLLLQEHNTLKNDIRFVTKQSEGPFLTVDESEWQKSISQNAIFMDYGSIIPFGFYSELLKLEKETAGNTVYFRYMALHADSETDSVNLYFKDERDKSYKKLVVKGAQSMLSVIDQGVSRDGIKEGVFFAFEEKDKILKEYPSLALETLLCTEGMELSKVNITNIFPEKDFSSAQSTFSSVTYNIIRLFSYNPDTPKKYYDAAGIWVLVENESTLKLFKDGRVEFEATEDRSGVPLNDYVEPGTSLSNTCGLVKAAYSFLNSALGTSNQTSNLVFSGIEYDEKSGEAGIYFDYRSNGMPVLLKEHGKFPIYLQIKNGVITRFSAELKGISQSEQKTGIIPLASVLNLFSKPERVNYKTLEICYETSLSTAMEKPKWTAFLE